MEDRELIMPKISIFYLIICFAVGLLSLKSYANESSDNNENSVIYEIIKGKGVGVCEDYKKNLESFALPRPLSCERNIYPNFSKFSKPEWEKVDLEEHREMFRRILSYNNGVRSQFHPWWSKNDETLDYKISYYKKRQYENILISKIDVNNDGLDENILMFKEGFCPNLADGFFKTSFYVLKQSPDYVDFVIDDKNSLELILRRHNKLQNVNFTTMEIFSYNGNTYIDKYCFGKNIALGCEGKNILSVYKIKTDMVEEVCQLKVIAFQ